MKTEVSNINTSEGQLRIWDNTGSGEVFHWATPDGSQGSEPSFADAVSAAFDAVGLPQDGASSEVELTIDEQNDAIRAQVEAEIPTPSGFESDDSRDEHKSAQEARFFQLVNNLPLRTF